MNCVEPFQVIQDGLLGGHENMAKDSRLLDRAENGELGCRVYGWDGLWVSIGRFQSLERGLVNPDTTRWVRRPTGGKAVLHGWDVTVGLAVPLTLLHLSDSRSLEPVYRCTVRPIVAALQKSGLDAILAADSPYAGSGVHSGDCFAFASPNDVVHAQTGQKLCGCALRLTKQAVLVQASIPYQSPTIDPAAVITAAKQQSVTPWEHSSFAAHLSEAINALWAQE